MSSFEAIVEELRALPPDRLERAADFIHRLRVSGHQERKAVLNRLAGVMDGERGEDFAREIEAGCEQVDERDW